MQCPDCGRWEPADRETGYDADELCPTCKLTRCEVCEDAEATTRRSDATAGMDYRMCADCAAGWDAAEASRCRFCGRTECDC